MINNNKKTRLNDISKNPDKPLLNVTAGDLMQLSHPCDDPSKPAIATLKEEQAERYENSLDGVSAVAIPRPQSKETALVMLADSCEATVRARRPPTPQDLAQVVNEVFDRLVAAEQLDECPLTIRDLDVVRKSFVSTLRGVLHPRIRYPEPVAPALEHGASEPVAPLSAQVLASESAEE